MNTISRVLPWAVGLLRRLLQKRSPKKASSVQKESTVINVKNVKIGDQAVKMIKDSRIIKTDGDVKIEGKIVIVNLLEQDRSGL